jgi:A/G-specific adenine glycosylase
MKVSLEKARIFVTELLKWGDRNRRNFPWRATINPFHILVAELMLQRTNASQVAPVYLKFIDKYPSPQDVALAKLEDVSEDLRPLGLAYRANRLKQIADILLLKYDGRVPESEAELVELPGVGKYVANAVLCFAFGKMQPLVDANIIRVMTRIFSVEIPGEAHKKPEFWNLMKEILPAEGAREFNLSILDFASMICKSSNPDHDVCPVRNVCNFIRT